MEVKAVACITFSLWGPALPAHAASPALCVLLACWIRPWLWEWEKYKWLPQGVGMGQWVEHQNNLETAQFVNFELLNREQKSSGVFGMTVRAESRMRKVINFYGIPTPCQYCTVF